MPRTTTHLLLSACLAFAATACTPADADGPGEDETLPWSGDSETVLVDDDKADSGEPLRVRADGMTIWFRPALEAIGEGGAQRFVVRGRTSRNLADAFSFVPDDAFGRATVTGPRTFEIELDAHETNSVLFGNRLLVRLETIDGRTYTAMVRARARVVGVAGTGAIFPSAAIGAVYVDREVSYRGSVGLGRDVTFISPLGPTGQRSTSSLILPANILGECSPTAGVGARHWTAGGLQSAAFRADGAL